MPCHSEARFGPKNLSEGFFATLRMTGWVLFILLLVASPALAQPDAFNAYWFNGQAEISTYELEQTRYGETRKGKATLIFVTEDFLPDGLVKPDVQDKAKTGAVSILKLNKITRFPTGIYDYSVMTSVFTPTAPLNAALKINTSVQDWCGQTWMQAVRKGDGWLVESRSYFEKEGDVTANLPGVLSEDEIWTRVRLDPSKLPTGAITTLPSQQWLRLAHVPLAPMQAKARLEKAPDTSTYTLQYDEGRVLAIRFQTALPHLIQGWEESHTDTVGTPAKQVTSKATISKTVRSDYWNHHTNADLPLRQELGLDVDFP